MSNPARTPCLVHSSTFYEYIFRDIMLFFLSLFCKTVVEISSRAAPIGDVLLVASQNPSPTVFLLLLLR